MNKKFATGSRTKMFGTNDRVKDQVSGQPAEARPDWPALNEASPLKRSGGKVRSAAVDEAGDMGGSRAANPRRPAA